MKQKNTTIFTTIIALIYTITVICLIASLAFSYKVGKLQAQNQTDSFSNAANEILKKYTPDEADFIPSLEQAARSFSTAAYIEISSNGTLCFAYPHSSSTAHAHSPFLHGYSTTVNGIDNKQYTLVASYYLLKPSVVFYKGRIAFLFILAATIACIIYLIVFAKSGSEEHDDSFEDDADTDSNDTHSSFEPESIMSHISDYDDNKNEEIETSYSALAGKEDDDMQEENFSAPVEKNTIDNSMDNHEEEEEEKNENVPNGLFSPITGFGWESYMTTRLESELIRAASNEQDLSLFTIRIPYLDRTCATAKEIYKLLLETFKFKDLLFEYKDDGCSAIMQNSNIDQALVIAENLHIQITSLLSKAGLENTTAIGISSRSLRLISGARLAAESEQALMHAFEDKESPVIAFRVNPDKYRDYLAAEAAKVPPEK